MKSKLFLIASCIVFITISSCKNNEKNAATSSTDTTVAASDTTKKTVYACPMHPEITSNEPAACSKCGMDLEIKNQ